MFERPHLDMVEHNHVKPFEGFVPIERKMNSSILLILCIFSAPAKYILQWNRSRTGCYFSVRIHFPFELQKPSRGYDNVDSF